MQLHCGAAKEVDDPAEFRQNLTQVTQVRLIENVQKWTKVDKSGQKMHKKFTKIGQKRTKVHKSGQKIDKWTKGRQG